MITGRDVAEANGFRLIAYYLQAGWLYEYRSVSIMDDSTWDYLCMRLDLEWDSLPEIEHKAKIDRAALGSATAQYLTDDHVPLICQHAACRRMQEFGLQSELGGPREPKPLPDEVPISEFLADLF